MLDEISSNNGRPSLFSFDVNAGLPNGSRETRLSGADPEICLAGLKNLNIVRDALE